MIVVCLPTNRKLDFNTKLIIKAHIKNKSLQKTLMAQRHRTIQVNTSKLAAENLSFQTII